MRSSAYSVRGRASREKYYRASVGRPLLGRLGGSINILECGGCHTLYCQRALYCSEWGDGSDSESYYQYSYLRR